MNVCEEIDWLEKLTYKDDIELAYNPRLNKITGLYVLNEDSDNVSLDSLIAKLIVTLNKIDFVQTEYCCSGHENDSDCYISFKYNKRTSDLATKLLRECYYNGVEILNIPRNRLFQALTVETKLEITVDYNEAYGTDNDLKINFRINSNYITRKERSKLFEFMIDSLIAEYN